ncbi:aminotransferase class I/II-fold pyridoxal phosphate-dependent enzyme [Microbacterium sp. LRZ72]|uniref:aminotransferase-like domain-containing protein n=1 Tax=Microbacterium sp. LRZ72 TaxID=2942481 RepID=UPI0029B17571|nr:aminotransferase class I/II-fold pyridoxal phosphate-dependent enzyme [Microbacterium sp. LRZ72]MDX2376655.1 aminotransferase class I/II-fold pyridoxal phosphate-dependent enzyme [Microbacterium sp. LRZ72]
MVESADLDLDFGDRSPPSIASALSRAISEGDLAPAARLPTVRQLAAQLGVSPATVSAAWQALSRAGLIVSRGRAGSFVMQGRAEWLTPRVQNLAAHPGVPALDLSRGTPDPDLLPALAPAFARVSLSADAGSYSDAPVLTELGELLARSWPHPAERITVLDGALDGMGRTLERLVSFGDRVAVESPGFPYLFDLLEALGAQVVPLDLDEHGVVPASLARAAATRLRAVVLQPRAQNPTGASMTEERTDELAAVLASVRDGDRVVVVEDDHSGMIATADDVTLARWMPGQVVHVRSFSKSHGPDLRLAALGGPAHIIDRVVARRMLGPGWTSRILQRILVELLTDPAAVAAVQGARERYRSRQAAVAASLRECGVRIATPDGVNLWMPVAHERQALLQLAAAGIAAALGSPFLVAPVPGDHLRLTTGLVPEPDAPRVARVLADAAHRASP